MNCTLYVNTSENNRLNKQLTDSLSFTFLIKDSSDISRPTIVIQSESDIRRFNYMYIPEFYRYYYIESIDTIANGRYIVRGKSDPLMSFKADIYNLPVLLMNTEQTGANNYLTGEIFKQTVKYKTDILNFPNGLSNSGEFILITAGG